MAKYVLVGAYTLDPERADWIRRNNAYSVEILHPDFLEGKFEDVSHVLLVGEHGVAGYYAVTGRLVVSRNKLTTVYHHPALVTSFASEYYYFHLDPQILPKNAVSPKKRNCLISLSDFIKSDMDKAVLTHAFHETKSDKSVVYERALAAITSKDVASVIKAQPEVVSVNIEQLDLFSEPPPFPPPEHPTFKFIDLFAGIGGFRIAMQNCGGKCVFTSEFDPAAQRTYQANFGEFPFGDITKQETHDKIPEHFDVVCAGFPCQAFSLAGKRMGFNDNYKGMCRGTLFKEVVEICEKHKPRAVFCENVKGLLIHDKGRTLQVIKAAFEEVGYQFYFTVLNSKDFGVPQNRERVYMVSIRNDVVDKLSNGDRAHWQFPFPKGDARSVTLNDIRETNVPARYFLSDVYMDTLRRHRARHEAAGHGFGYEIRKWDGISGAIVCGGMGRERNLVQEENGTPVGLVPETHIKGQINQEGIRKMTPREWARLQGFPEDFKFVLSDVHLYKQFGNSVSIPVIQAISRKIVETLIQY